MYKTFADLRAKRAKGENGFTLIELLVVVVILGVLIAIAIPVYLNYRKGANDSATESDVRNAVSVLEVCNASGGYPAAASPLTWPAASGAAGSLAVPTPCKAQTITYSAGTTMMYTASATGYMLTGTNANGAPKFWCYNSTTGGAVKEVTPTATPGTLATASC